MKIIHRKPGVILLPVSAVLIIFILLLILLIGQKQTNNELILEYRASRVINLLLDMYSSNQVIEPKEIDPDIIGFGIYDEQQKAVYRFGSAPAIIPAGKQYSDVVFFSRQSITIVRGGADVNELPPGASGMMQRVPENLQSRLNEMRQKRGGGAAGPMMMKYQSRVFLEYSNGSYITERRLILLISILFTVVFSASAVLIYRLYQSNRRLLVKTEHDKQLIQLGEAARTLAHEIRNPLGALKIQRDLLSRKLPDEYGGNLEIIDRELKRLNTLVERVGEFLRNPVGQPEKINIYNFAVNLYSSRFDVVIRGDQDAEILFDRERLRTVLDNLVNNAVESAGAADILISGGRRPGLDILDSGPGFTEEESDRLFDPFYTTKNNGTGLGLSVVKRLVDAAGGTISAANRREGGAAVRLRFGDRNESINS